MSVATIRAAVVFCACFFNCCGNQNSAARPAHRPPTEPTDLALQLTDYRGGNGANFVRPKAYDYAPSVILENGTYRMWWCGGLPDSAGDHILYAEASSLDGPWHSREATTPNSYDVVFAPTNAAADFDGQDTCDPSVVHYHGNYYLYYGAFPLASGSPPQVTTIGVAKSHDGMTWTRTHPNSPIVSPARSVEGLPNVYGAGQPSVVNMGNSLYMAYTDTSAVGSDPRSGAGIYVLRSQDSQFQVGVEELQKNGFAALDPNAHGLDPIAIATTIDWAYSDSLQLFILADDTPPTITLHLFEGFLQGAAPSLVISPALSYDGPGLVTDAERHLPEGNLCNATAIDLMRAVSDGTGTQPVSWDLAHVGSTLLNDRACNAP